MSYFSNAKLAVKDERIKQSRKSVFFVLFFLSTTSYKIGWELIARQRLQTAKFCSLVPLTGDVLENISETDTGGRNKCNIMAVCDRRGLYLYRVNAVSKAATARNQLRERNYSCACNLLFELYCWHCTIVTQASLHSFPSAASRLYVAPAFTSSAIQSHCIHFTLLSKADRLSNIFNYFLPDEFHDGGGEKG